MTMPPPSPIAPYPDSLAALFKAHPNSAFDYLEFRLYMARTAARLAAERATEEDRLQMTQAFQTLVTCHESDTAEAELQADAEFHLSIYRACHNAVMAFVMTTLITMQRRDVFYDRLSTCQQPGARESLMEQHRALYLAIMNRQGDHAAEAAETHIRFAGRILRDSMETARRLQVSLRRRKRATSPDGNPFLDDEKPPAKRRRAKASL